MADNLGNNLAERLKIQEKALQGLADKLERRGTDIDTEMQDIREELKALKMFLSRTVPDFKKQYPAIRKKLKAA